MQSTSYLIDTETMLEAARTAQADKLAPYEWTAANLYFAKSKEEVGYSDFEQAVDYGKKAVEFATRARDTALKVGRRSEPSAHGSPGGAHAMKRFQRSPCSWLLRRLPQRPADPRVGRHHQDRHRARPPVERPALRAA